MARGSRLAAEIETYVAWLAKHGYSAKTIWRRVPIVFAFGEFAGVRGAVEVGELSTHVESFVADRAAARYKWSRSRYRFVHTQQGEVRPAQNPPWRRPRAHSDRTAQRRFLRLALGRPTSRGRSPGISKIGVVNWAEWSPRK